VLEYAAGAAETLKPARFLPLTGDTRRVVACAPISSPALNAEAI
jgi:hypothetical protein